MIDAHVHFWDPRVMHYAWLRDYPALERPFLAENYPGRADGMIFVEGNCDPSEVEQELDFVDDLAVRDPRIIGSVAFVDLNDEATRDTTLTRFAMRKSVVGIRHNIQGNPPGFCLAPAFVRGVTRVAEYGLTFDLCCTADQLRDVIELIRMVNDRIGHSERSEGSASVVAEGRPGPEARFVLDHCGKPAIRDDAFAPWAEQLAELASFANVGCKISGLFTEARPDQHNARAMKPYVEHARACFGPERLLYGSDWPVVTLGGGEPLWRATIEELASAWSDTDRELFYGRNALRFYAIGNSAALEIG